MTTIHACLCTVASTNCTSNHRSFFSCCLGGSAGAGVGDLDGVLLGDLDGLLLPLPSFPEPTCSFMRTTSRPSVILDLTAALPTLLSKAFLVTPCASM
jgi:hypothetical protein